MLDKEENMYFLIAEDKVEGGWSSKELPRTPRRGAGVSRPSPLEGRSVSRVCDL